MSHKVSVVVPVRNMARFLPDAVASIPEVHEIILVAAESDDSTLFVVNELARQRRGIHVLTDPGKGPAVARNVGLRKAAGDVIAFNDADDIWPQGKLALQLERLDREPQVDVVGGFVTYFEELAPNSFAPASSSRTETTFLHHVGAAIFRRSVFARIGLFDETLTYAEDGDLLLRIVENEVPFVILMTPTLYYRRHADSMMTRDQARQKSDLARAFGLSLARRRKRGQSLTRVSFERYFEPLPRSP